MQYGKTHDFPFTILDVANILRLNIRRRMPNQVYVDCPICGDRRGKMNLNLAKNLWRCNYCGEGGGMLALYAKVNGVSNSDAYREICDALTVGDSSPIEFPPDRMQSLQTPQAEIASAQEIHKTFSLLLSMLTLRPAHRDHLRRARGLSDEQIERYCLRSTPPPALCTGIAERLHRAGCQIQGVPGFYINNYGKWTIRFYQRTTGIIIPIVGVDGLICGLQTRLDHPIRSKDDPPEKEGIKYLTLSSSEKPMGVSSGSPIHFVGDPCSRVVYVTEGCLKADIAHALSGRTFAAVIGAGNVSGLDRVFASLRRSGTKEIIEAEDMDKYRNTSVDKGSSKIAELARKHGMECRRLTWNPNYKGIDDWLLALRKKADMERVNSHMGFKEAYLNGLCSYDTLQHAVAQWRQHNSDDGGLRKFLGLTEEEYAALVSSSDALKTMLDRQRRLQAFRIYQLDLDGGQVIPFAFSGLAALHKAGFDQPPAPCYRLVHEGSMVCPVEQEDLVILSRIFRRYNDDLPANYCGRSVSPSDVIELCQEEKGRYFYREQDKFSLVRFSPAQCKNAMQVRGS